MAKKAWQQKADSYLEALYGLLRMYEQGAYIGQEPYKGDFFRVFAQAYRDGYCTPSYHFDVAKGRYVKSKAQKPLIQGETIWHYAKDRGWVRSDMDVDDKRYRDITILSTWWDEWVYAWNPNPPPRKYLRTKWIKGDGSDQFHKEKGEGGS